MAWLQAMRTLLYKWRDKVLFTIHDLEWLYEYIIKPNILCMNIKKIKYKNVTIQARKTKLFFRLSWNVLAN